MKKIALCALVLLVGLPSCRKDRTSKEKQQKPSTEQRVDMFSDSGSDYDVDEDYFEDEDDLRTLFDFDEESEELVLQDDGSYDGSEEEYVDVSEDIAWIDAQIDDELKPLCFEFNKYELNASQKQALAHDIEQIKQLLADAGTDTKAIVVSEGHTCQEGSREYNIALSENRAMHVADLLVSAGVDRHLIKVVGRGQENPLVDGKTRAERAPNRRVEVRVIYT